MKRTLIALVACVAFTAPAFAADPDPCVPGNDPNIPRGGGFPGTVMSADFDGDGTEDRACARLSDLDTEGPFVIEVEFGPFDSMGYPTGGHAVLEEYRNSKEFGDSSVGIVTPGLFKSLCIKGYDECRHGEESYAFTTRPSVSIGTEGASWMYIYTGRDPEDQRKRLFRSFYLSD